MKSDFAYICVRLCIYYICCLHMQWNILHPFCLQIDNCTYEIIYTHCVQFYCKYMWTATHLNILYIDFCTYAHRMKITFFELLRMQFQCTKHKQKMALHQWKLVQLWVLTNQKLFLPFSKAFGNNDFRPREPPPIFLTCLYLWQPLCNRHSVANVTYYHAVDSKT